MPISRLIKDTLIAANFCRGLSGNPFFFFFMADEALRREVGARQGKLLLCAINLCNEYGLEEEELQ